MPWNGLLKAARKRRNERVAAWRHEHRLCNRHAARSILLECRHRKPGQVLLRCQSHPGGSAPRICPLAVVPLTDVALSVSAVWGKSFSSGDRISATLLIPAPGVRRTARMAAAVVVPSATESDAFSTALLTLGAEGHDQIANLRSGMRTLLVTRTSWPRSSRSFHAASSSRRRRRRSCHGASNVFKKARRGSDALPHTRQQPSRHQPDHRARGQQRLSAERHRSRELEDLTPVIK